MNGVDEIGLVVVEIVAIGDQTELLEDAGVWRVPRIAEDNQALADLPTTRWYASSVRRITERSSSGLCA
jgi:hypothetical protein